MKKIFLTLMLLAMGLLAYGSDFVVTHRTPTGDMVSRVLEDDETDDFSQTAMRPKAPVFKEGEEPELITLHIKFKYPENLVPEYVAYAEGAMGFYVDYEGKDEVYLRIIKDYFKSNIIYGSFASTDSTENPDDCYWVFMYIPEFTDGMEIEIDANTICNTYTLEFLNPDGKPLKTRHQLYDPSTKEVVYDGEGDINDLWGQIFVYQCESDMIVSKLYHVRNRSYTDGREDKILVAPVIYTNSLPQNLAICANGLGDNTIEDYREMWMLQTIPTRDSGCLSNEGVKYISKEFNISKTPYGDSNPLKVNYNLLETIGGLCSIELARTSDNAFGVTSFMRVSSKTICEENGGYANVVVCVPEASMKGLNTVQSLVRITTSIDVGTDRYQGISTQFFQPEGNVLVYEPRNMTIADYNGINLYLRTFGNWIYPNIYKEVNQFLPSGIDKYRILIGNSTPTLTSLGVWDKDNGVVPEFMIDYLRELGYLEFGYTGRNGESMTIDWLTAMVDTEREGDVLKYIINNDNVLIDGKVPGFNNTVLGCMIETDDWVPPTLQSLMFINKEGEVIDRFQSAEEATMMFYAGDFQYALNEDYTEDMMIVSPLGEVKVEYAPYGSDDFAALTVNEVPEKFFMPGYGYCYEGSLASVNRQSENGWFDLRISLTDENGNYQTQVISPAFKIDSLSGVDTVGDMRESMQIVDGRIVSNSGNAVSVYNIDGREVRNDNLAPGIYVARIGAMSQKIIVR